MKKYLEILQKCQLFDKIEKSELNSMLECLGATISSISKKQVVIEEGKEANFVGIVLSGKLQIERTDYYGNRSIIASIGPSELFGESFACANTSFPFDIISVEESTVLWIDCRKIITTCSCGCDFHNKMIFNLLKVVATKNIMLTQKAEITSKRTTREKLLGYLLLQAKKNNSNCFTIPFDRQELADFLEVDRSGLSNEISKLRNEGILQSHKNSFILNEQ